ncbi:MAG: iron ABC transporter substrate-binding protein [Alphaproteobacteria bacterium]|nr:iron ABC transporter substrate-binding protein [Alphaproteobacteria bacterium]MBU0798170.1 iron ABC transporter substrate-binding protein [Alphaproteobacteria bacterium]MBU0887611.1 iron ABC transporter substrate-binding protein [Alphaproteobacteria bacterium]MBU1814263.1 iron ABC transporter substrate-binding protein [Alphaproteobacteria bacterium]
MPRLGFHLLACALLLIGAARADAGQVEDSAGRVVAVPQRVERVFAAGPPAAIVLYTLAPEKLLGWTRALSPAEDAYLPERWRGLPGHGRLTGRGNSANLEAVLTLRPDLVVDLGSVGPTFVTLADRVQEQTGIPTLLLGGRLDELPDAYRLLGTVLGREARANLLATYIEDMLDAVQRRIASVPPAERPRFYYARGPRGLDTALTGSINVEAMDFVGARNVAGEAIGKGGLAAVSLEQIIAWNPSVIITAEPGFARQVRDNPNWRTISAVRQDNILLAPQFPFPWIDFPPSVNRVIGVRWLAAKLYPALFPEPLEPIVRGFYSLFYDRPLSDAEMSALIAP